MGAGKSDQVQRRKDNLATVRPGLQSDKYQLNDPSKVHLKEFVKNRYEGTD